MDYKDNYEFSTLLLENNNDCPTQYDYYSLEAEKTTIQESFNEDYIDTININTTTDNIDTITITAHDDFTEQRICNKSKSNTVSLNSKSTTASQQSIHQKRTNKILYEKKPEHTTEPPEKESPKGMTDEEALLYGAKCEKLARERDYMEKLGIDPESYHNL